MRSHGQRTVHPEQAPLPLPLPWGEYQLPLPYLPHKDAVMSITHVQYLRYRVIYKQVLFILLVVTSQDASME